MVATVKMVAGLATIRILWKAATSCLSKPVASQARVRKILTRSPFTLRMRLSMEGSGKQRWQLESFVSRTERCVSRLLFVVVE
jgi:hypothetical protein